MNNQDTGIRPAQPGQSVRAINWYFGEDKKPELHGPVGTYIGPNYDEDADMDQNGIFEFFGKRTVGDTKNGFAVVEEKPHTTEAFVEALNSFVEIFPMGDQGAFSLTTQSGEVKIATMEELIQYKGDSWAFYVGPHIFCYRFDENDNLIVLFFTHNGVDKQSFFIAPQ